jgi:y4mF family transcriptional regulator
MWAQSPAEIGKIIAAARRHHKLTQASLARALGTTQGWVSEVEQGKETAQVGKILRALSYLGVRLQTGVVPWGGQRKVGKTAVSRPAGVSLASIISGLSKPARGPGKK